MKSATNKIIVGVVSGLVIGAGAGIIVDDTDIVSGITTFDKAPQEIKKVDLIDANSKLLEQMAADAKDKPVDYQLLGC